MAWLRRAQQEWDNGCKNVFHKGGSLLLRIQKVFVCCVILAATAGCRAQAPTTLSKTKAKLDARIETAIRNELSVPPVYNVTIGPEKKSDLSGYNSILVTFSLPGHPDRTQQLTYLVSTDGNTLARLSKIDISQGPNAGLPIAGRAIRGNPKAKVTLVNFDDLECPFCARMHAELFPGIMDKYKGLIRVIYVDFPLTQIHPWAMHAAVDANCLESQSGKAYWNYVDYVHTHGEDISGPQPDLQKSFATLDQLAEQEGTRDKLDTSKLDACVKAQDESVVRKEMMAGDKLGISATPTFYVNGVRWAGVLDKPDLELMINRALRQEGITPPVSTTAQDSGSAHSSKSAAQATTSK
jgi:protein-disulfide isomerase